MTNKIEITPKLLSDLKELAVHAEGCDTWTHKIIKSTDPYYQYEDVVSCAFYNPDKDGYVGDTHISHLYDYISRFFMAAKPAVVLALVETLEELQGREDGYKVALEEGLERLAELIRENHKLRDQLALIAGKEEAN